MLAKRFVSSKNLKNLTMPKTVKGDPLRFFNIRCCKISKKQKGTLWGHFRRKSLRKPKKGEPHSAKKV